MRDAQILILDEPTSALDAQAEHDLFERIRQLTEGGQTPQPVQATQEQVAQAIAAVTAPEPPPPPPPAMPMEAPQAPPEVAGDGLPDFQPDTK